MRACFTAVVIAYVSANCQFSTSGVAAGCLNVRGQRLDPSTGGLCGTSMRRQGEGGRPPPAVKVWERSNLGNFLKF